MQKISDLLRKCANVLALFLLCSALATTLLAQNQAGSVSGILTDSSGAVLRGAQISIPSKGLLVSTDEQGRFFFSGLQTGDYMLSVSYIGFDKLTKVLIRIFNESRESLRCLMTF